MRRVPRHRRRLTAYERVLFDVLELVGRHRETYGQSPKMLYLPPALENALRDSTENELGAEGARAALAQDRAAWREYLRRYFRTRLELDVAFDAAELRLA